MVGAVSHRERTLRSPARDLGRRGPCAPRVGARRRGCHGSTQQLLRHALPEPRRRARARHAAQRPARARLAQRRRRAGTRWISTLLRLDHVTSPASEQLAACARGPRPTRRAREVRNAADGDGVARRIARGVWGERRRRRAAGRLGVDMTTNVTPAPLALVRSIIAHTALGEQAEIGHTIGRVTLRPHQQAAATRLAALISANGGALLADPVGVGKTYTSLAVAAR